MKNFLFFTTPKTISGAHLLESLSGERYKLKRTTSALLGEEGKAETWSRLSAELDPGTAET